MSIPDNFADVAVTQVLHFARDDRHFLAMLEELWRSPPPWRHALLTSLGSRIGMDFPHLRGNLYQIGDGSEWFLVDESMLLELTDSLNAVLVDPLKTTVVQDYRCMTTWVLRKRSLKRDQAVRLSITAYLTQPSSCFMYTMYMCACISTIRQ